jgi:hypothetical protein
MSAVVGTDVTSAIALTKLMRLIFWMKFSEPGAPVSAPVSELPKVVVTSGSKSG